MESRHAFNRLPAKRDVDRWHVDTTCEEHEISHESRYIKSDRPARDATTYAVSIKTSKLRPPPPPSVYRCGHENDFDTLQNTFFVWPFRAGLGETPKRRRTAIETLRYFEKSKTIEWRIINCRRLCVGILTSDPADSARVEIVPLKLFQILRYILKRHVASAHKAHDRRNLVTG